jgi:hypothetical protein
MARGARWLLERPEANRHPGRVYLKDSYTQKDRSFVPML